MLIISPTIQLADWEIELTAIRAQGAGGQNVNKVSSAIHLRFHIASSSLPSEIKQRLLSRSDHRVNSEGYVVIKAQQFRSQIQNREDALQRLVEFIRPCLTTAKKRRATKPSYSAKQKRMNHKTQRGQVKSMRGKPSLD